MSEPEAAPAGESDEALVASAQAGDHEAFARLVRRHQGMVAGLLYRFVGSAVDVEDLAQETFLRAYRQLPRWRPEAPFVHWLRRVAVNVGRDHYRARSRRPESLPLDEAHLPPGEDGASAVRAAAASEVRAVLRELPENDCLLLTLHFLEGMTFHEIGGHFGWSAVATRVRAFRARRKLHQLLLRHGYTP